MSMTGIGREADIFLCALLSGIVVAMVYQILRVFRNIIRHSYLTMNVEDFFYWMAASGYWFYQMYCTTYGVVRWYFILGIAIGFFGAKYLCFWVGNALLKMQKKLEKSPENK